MRIIEAVLPILVMLALGAQCRRRGWLSPQSIGDLKFLVTNIMLPVAVFHALATAEYDYGTLVLVGIMLAALAVSFGVGFLLRPLMDTVYRKYLPFMVSVYEGGLMAYPLFANLCGQEHLSRIAVLDIAGLLFGFSIYMGLLTLVETGGKPDIKALACSALKTPAFIASVLGVTAELLGIVPAILNSAWGGVYTAVENMLTTSVTAIILVVVGYSIELTPALVRPCGKTIFLRVVVQFVTAFCVLLAANRLLGTDRIRDIAIITYMSAPTTFSMQTFLKSEPGSAYVSTTNSLYCMVSVLVYMVMAAIG